MQSEKEFFLRKFSKIPILHIAYTITTVWELTESQESYTPKSPRRYKMRTTENNGVMPPVVKKDGYDEKHLTSCELFSVKDITVNKSYSSVADSNSFVSILVIDGNGSLICENETFPLCKGDSYFISADSGEFKICGNVNLIETRV